MKRAFGMAPALIRRGHEVTILMEAAEDNRRFAKEIAGVKTVEHRPGHTTFAMRREKEDLVAKGGYDIVHICGLGWRNALRPHRLGARFTIMDHVEIESALTAVNPIRRALQSALESWSLRTYSAHVGASRYLEAWLRMRLFEQGRSKPVLWLSYANDFAGVVPERSLIEITIKTYAGKKILLYFGNFYRNYGFWELLNAARALGATRRDFVMVLAGRGPEEKAGREFVDANQLDDVVKFPGYLSGQAALAHLAAAHTCVVPLFETETDWARSPGKIFISMNSRRPIVTADVGEARDCFLDARFFCSPARLQSFVETLGRALDMGEGWTPNYRPEAHTWECRAEAWLEWVSAQLGGS